MDTAGWRIRANWLPLLTLQPIDAINQAIAAKTCAAW
jgi:hypothetical protein